MYRGALKWLVLLTVFAIVAAACSSDDPEPSAGSVAESPPKTDSSGAVISGGPATGQANVPPKIVPSPTTTVTATTTTTTVPPPVSSDRFVDAVNGDDSSNGGSQGQAWQSLAFAIGQLEPGMTLFVMDGVYDENMEGPAHYLISQGGTADEWVRILAAPGASPRIEASVDTAVEIGGASYVEMSGFEIAGVGFDANNDFGYGILGVSGHHFEFRDNEIYGMPNAGIGGGEGSSHFTIVNNLIHDNALWSADGSSGISLWRLTNYQDFDDESDGYSNRIIRNELYGNENRKPCNCVNGRAITDGNGIIIDQNDLDHLKYTGRTLIAENVIYNNGGRGINIFQSRHVDVRNNTLFQNAFTTTLDGRRAEVATYQSNDIVIENNILWPLDGLPPVVIEQGDASVENNIHVGPNPGGDDANDYVTDPGFVLPSLDPDVADFRLRNDSPALGTAVGGGSVGALSN